MSALLSIIGGRWQPAGISRLQNPAFPAPDSGYRAERARMLASPTGLASPLVVIGGWRTPRYMAWDLARDLCNLAGGERSQIAAVGMLLCGSMDSAVDRVIRTVEASWPGDNPRETAEVDAIGISMGGLIARAAAIAPVRDHRKRLALRRLFTLGTPHRGASLAARITVDAQSRDMRPGSRFLADLDQAMSTANYELICYARTRDVMVGATNCAPAGAVPHWLHGPLVLSHSTMWMNPLIRLDIARRLRGEPPLSRSGDPPPRN